MPTVAIALLVETSAVIVQSAELLPPLPVVETVEDVLSILDAPPIVDDTPFVEPMVDAPPIVEDTLFVEPMVDAPPMLDAVEVVVTLLQGGTAQLPLHSC